MQTIELKKPDVTRFHLSLNVNDLGKTVSFLTALLGCPPKKMRTDYAKFEPADLPVVLSLEPRTEPQPPLRNTSGEGPLNHVGIRMTSANQLVDVQRRLEAAGYATQREDGVECCYARQTKFWVLDHDRTMWEVYVLDEDIEHRGNAESTLANTGRESTTQSGTVCQRRSWAHRLSDEFPSVIPGSGELDEVFLQGSWNAKRHEGHWADQLARARAALRPGGKLSIHLLTANESVTLTNPLPGPAAVVEVVPSLSEVFAAVESQGFVHLRLAKYGANPCFRHDGTEMRETRLEASVPSFASTDERFVPVLYRGPCNSVAIDGLGTFARGESRWISEKAWEQFVAMPGSESFVRLTQPERAGAIQACGVVTG
jgi:hypothetical protein